MTAATIHATAVVHPSAVIAPGAVLGPYCVVGERAYVGENTVLGPHVVVDDFTTVGRDCRIHAGAVIGGVSQDLKAQGDESYCVLGDRNTIREYVTINRATAKGDTTRVGSDNLLMAYVHVAHDCDIGNRTILANGVTLAGHVVVEDDAFIGGMSGLHQFIRVGRMAMVGAMSRLVQDVPPYMLVEGRPPRVYGLNTVGLRRKGIPAQERALLKAAYKHLYRSRASVAQALAHIRQLPEAESLAHLVGFVQASSRGLVGASRQDAGLEAEA